jgi:hypothetical protein
MTTTLIQCQVVPLLDDLLKQNKVTNSQLGRQETIKDISFQEQGRAHGENRTQDPTHALKCLQSLDHHERKSLESRKALNKPTC